MKPTLLWKESPPTEIQLQLTDIDGDILGDPSSFRWLFGRLVYLTITRRLTYFTVLTSSTNLGTNHGARFILDAVLLRGEVDIDGGIRRMTRRSGIGYCIFYVTNAFLRENKSKLFMSICLWSLILCYRYYIMWIVVANVPPWRFWHLSLLTINLFCDNWGSSLRHGPPFSWKSKRYWDRSLHRTWENLFDILRPSHLSHSNYMAGVFRKYLDMMHFIGLFWRRAC